MAMPSLSYLSRDWECSEEIREHVRRSKRILDWDDVKAQKGTPESKGNRRKRAKMSPKVTPKKRRVRKNLQKDFDQASDVVEKLMGSPKVKALAAKRRKDQAKIALKMLHESKLVGLEVPLELDQVLLDFIYNQTGV